MGLTFSAPLNEDSMSNQTKVQNIQSFANANVEENNILDTLNLSELNPSVKKQMPLVGGNEYTSEGEFAYNFPQSSNRKERYNNYDLFNIMTKLEAKNNIVGGNLKEEELNLSSTSNTGMTDIKKIILEEIDNYKKNNAHSENGSLTGGGDCGCAGESKVLEGGKKKKAKKVKKVMKGGISSSESSSNNFKINREEITNATSNEELEEEKGLSIFPLNSSDISIQTSSERNFRMIRRKI